MKLYKSAFADNCCFKFEEATREICPYFNDSVISPHVDIEQFSSFLLSFMSIFKHDKEGDEVLEIIKKDWQIFNNSSEFNIECYFNDLMHALSLPYKANTRVVYVDEILEACDRKWEVIKKSLMYKRRYTIPSAFDLEDLGWDQYFNDCICELKNAELFRARIHEDGQIKEYSPDAMVAPSADKSRSGRANPEGISYTYLCRDYETTAYEVRAIPLDIISIAKFKICDTLKIVDLTKVESPFSCDVDDYIALAKKNRFIQLIANDMSKPMRRYSKSVEYIPTQFICEFIRHVVGADGVQFFSSIYKSGINVVVFDDNKLKCDRVDRYTVQEHKLTIKPI